MFPLKKKKRLLQAGENLSVSKRNCYDVTNKLKRNVLTSNSPFCFYKETWCWAWTCCIGTSNRNTDDIARQCSIAVCFPLEDKRQLRPDTVHKVYESVNQVSYAFPFFIVTVTLLNW